MKPIYELNLVHGVFQVFNEKPNFDFKSAKQIHSNIIVSEEIADGIILADGIWGNSNSPKCVLTADCVPIVIEGEKGHAIIHAGWAGIQKKIVLDENIFKIGPTLACIGPHISLLNYEVQNDFKTNFPHSDSFFETTSGIYFNLAQEISNQLTRNFPNIKIVNTNICTYNNTDFHSYRRDKTSKRNFNIYRPHGA